MQQLKSKLISLVEHAWYKQKPWYWVVLWPVSLIYSAAVKYLRFFRNKSNKWPIIVVGNIVAGGSGKTPMVAYIANFLQKQGYKVAIISRGYARKTQGLYVVSSQSTVAEVGDEPLWLYQQCHCQVIVSESRYQAAKLVYNKVDWLISDDGLQHYKLPRCIEIGVINQLHSNLSGMLPFGPLRESYARLKLVDINITQMPWCANKTLPTLHNGYAMWQKPLYWQGVTTKLQKSIDAFAQQKVYALTSIAMPQRFFALLRELGCVIVECALGDHSEIIMTEHDFVDAPVLMTAKDAVKCQDLHRNNLWFLVTELEVAEKFNEELNRLVIQHNNKVKQGEYHNVRC